MRHGHNMTWLHMDTVSSTATKEWMVQPDTIVVGRYLVATLTSESSPGWTGMPRQRGRQGDLWTTETCRSHKHVLRMHPYTPKCSQQSVVGSSGLDDGQASDT